MPCCLNMLQNLTFSMVAYKALFHPLAARTNQGCCQPTVKLSVLCCLTMLQKAVLLDTSRASCHRFGALRARPLCKGDNSVECVQDAVAARVKQIKNVISETEHGL